MKEAEESEATNEADENDSPSYLQDACPHCGSFTLYLDAADNEIACDTCGQISTAQTADT